MFDKLKQIQKLKGIQDELGKERIEFEKDGIKVIINGKMEIESIEINPQLNKEDQERALKGCINDALKKVQMIAMQKMMQSGNMEGMF